MKLLKRGTKFRIAPYGRCVVSGYDEIYGKYLMRVWDSSETFYASQEEIDKKCLTNRSKYDIISMSRKEINKRGNNDDSN